MEIRKVGVLGCGLMGAGIAQTSASAGFETTVREVSEELLQKGFAGIEKSLERFAAKETITAEQQKQTRDRLFGTTSFDDLADCDIIIEAIIENLEEKQNTYRQLDLQTRHDLCVEHFVAFDNADDGGNLACATAAVHWHALLQSRADHETGRSRAHHSY
jgi:3-hydroxyacyl-CoA dehydrogenase